MSWIVMACVYAVWLAAGALDFHFHRRTDLPHTSAMRESLLHGLQLLLIGSGVLAWLVLESTWLLVTLLAVLVIAHAIAGYLDTVSADGRRRISPAEQHVHSVLDAAPWVLLGGVAWQAEPRWAVNVAPAAPALGVRTAAGAWPGGVALAVGAAPVRACQRTAPAVSA